MVDQADVMDYIDKRMCKELFGIERTDYNIRNHSYYRWSMGSVGDMLTDEKQRRLAGLKKNRFVAKAKRRAKLEEPAFQEMIGKEIISRYLKNNPDVDLNKHIPVGSDIAQIIKESLCIGKFISPSREEGKVDTIMSQRCEVAVDIFEKFRTKAMCGSLEKPLDEARRVREEILKGEWICSES